MSLETLDFLNSNEELLSYSTIWLRVFPSRLGCEMPGHGVFIFVYTGHLSTLLSSRVPTTQKEGSKLIDKKFS